MSNCETEQLRKIEIAITDYCNLDCCLCSQATPLQKNKKIMSLEEMERISRLIGRGEFDYIKISGGEPTLHPQFAQMCGNLRTWFPTGKLELATNGCLLEKYLGYLDVFDHISLSRYPGKNDDEVDRIEARGLCNVRKGVKADYEGMIDVFAERNLHKRNIFKQCEYRNHRKIVQDRIYPCCVIFGQGIRQNIDPEEISVPLDANWRENLARLDIERHCRRCCVDVPVQTTEANRTAARTGAGGEEAAEMNGTSAERCRSDRGDTTFGEFAERLREKWREVPSTRKGRTFSSEMLGWSDEKLLSFWEECRRQVYHPEMRCWQFYGQDFAHMEIADVGPGLGFDGFYLAERGAHVTFVDVVQDNLKLLRRIFQLKGIDADYYYIDDFFEFRFNRRFDLIIAMGSLHHTPFEYMQKQVGAMMRFLKINGRVLMLTYPKERFIASRAKDFAEFGRMTDGERTPWAEWYDDEKVQRLFGPDFRLNWSRNFGKKNTDFNWFDLTKIRDERRLSGGSESDADGAACPYLSIVVTSRNDDHGGNTLHRTRVFARALIEQCGRFGLDAELVFVEWNPPADRPRLREVLDMPDDLGPLTVRFIEVPSEIHNSIGNADKFPLFQMIAKNVGIRRARGRFVLATNIDILLNDEVMEFLASGRLEEDCFYRIDRHDAGACRIPEDLDVPGQLAFCKGQVVRVHSMYGTKGVGEIGADHIKYGCGDTKLHTHACGDFTLMGRKHWHALRGYPELPLWSIYVDGLLLHMAYMSGLRQVVLDEPMRIYHIEHETGYEVIGETKKERPSLDYVRDYKGWCKRMLDEKRPLTNNGEDWGYAGVQFAETGPAGRLKVGNEEEPFENRIETFQAWIDVLAAAEKRVYYRDQTVKSLDALCELARRLRPTKIIELGTLSGMSLRAWVEAGTGAEVIAVDLSFTALQKSRQIVGVDLSSVRLIEQDILRLDFRGLWSEGDRVLLYVDAHDTAKAAIMEHLLSEVVPALPTGSVVMVDDLWYSHEPVSPEAASRLMRRVVRDEVDPLQFFEGWFAPYWKGGFLAGFREVVPLMRWVNRNRIEMAVEHGGKAAYFVAGAAGQAGGEAFDEAGFAGNCGMMRYNPVAGAGVADDSDAGRHAAELCRRGEELFAMRRTGEALECFEQASLLTAPIKGAGYARAVCHAAAGELEKALEALAGGEVSKDGRALMLREGIEARLAVMGKIEGKIGEKIGEKIGGEPGAGRKGRVTIFSMPKPFQGHIGVIQRNAIRSWTRLDSRFEVILFGNDAGTQELASELGVRHVAEVRRNERGTPLVDDLFRQAQQAASGDVLIYVNADIILTSDLVRAVDRVRGRFEEFLMIGRRHDIDMAEDIDFDDPAWEQRLRGRVEREGVLHGVRGIDYFAFTRDLWSEIPPFALGRTAWDNWLVWEAYLKHDVIDATECVTATHQNHLYGHAAGGRQEIWEGAEARHNQQLAGDLVIAGLGSTEDVTWRLTQGDIVRNCPPGYPQEVSDFCLRMIERGWRDKAAVHKQAFESVEHLREVGAPNASVIIIAWRLHPDARKNLEALARQRDRNFEVIFVDNGGRRGEFAELRPYVDTYVRLNRNTGAYLARNAGAVFARGPILIFVDDDGIVGEDFVGGYLELFATYDIVAARGSIWPKDRTAGPYGGHQNYGDRAFPYFSCTEGNSAYAAGVFYRAGGWDDKIIRGGGGLDLCRRLLEIEPDMRKQIYSPRPVLHHDVVREGPEHAEKKRLLEASIERLRRKHFDYDVFQECYRSYLQREDLLIRRGNGGSECEEHLYHNQELYRHVLSLRNAALENRKALGLNEEGKSRLAAGDAEGAAKVFAAAAEMWPSNAAVHNNLGIALWQAGRKVEAMRSMVRALRLNPADRITVLTIARFYRSMDLVEEARRLLTAYVNGNPGDTEVGNELAAISGGGGARAGDILAGRRG